MVVTELSPEILIDLPSTVELEIELSDLAARSDDINVFYEHWMLLPALRTFAAQSQVTLVTVRDSGGKLFGLFPFERTRHDRIGSVPVLKLWRHVHCFLCTPLVDRDYVTPVADALGSWLESGAAGAAIVQFHSFAAEGLFGQVFLPSFGRRSGWVSDVGTATRAVLTRGVSWENSISGKHLKDVRRIRRRLSELGSVEHRVLKADEDCEPWIEHFLALEASGWKGRAHTALDSNGPHSRYFREVASAAHRLGRLQFMALDVAGVPVAMKCNFLALPGAFAFKIAYQEELKKYSPGFLLELFNMDYLCDHCPTIAWMDSCADSGHAMAERLWPGRRIIGSQTSAGRGLLSRALVFTAPRYRRIKSMVRNSRVSPATAAQNDHS